jgi:hypothetical protein
MLRNLCFAALEVLMNYLVFIKLFNTFTIQQLSSFLLFANAKCRWWLINASTKWLHQRPIVKSAHHFCEKSCKSQLMRCFRPENASKGYYLCDLHRCDCFKISTQTITCELYLFCVNTCMSCCYVLAIRREKVNCFYFILFIALICVLAIALFAMQCNCASQRQLLRFGL